MPENTMSNSRRRQEISNFWEGRLGDRTSRRAEIYVTKKYFNYEIFQREKYR